MNENLTKEEIRLLSAIVAGKAASVDSVEKVCSEVLVKYQKAVSVFNKTNNGSNDGLFQLMKQEAGKLNP